MNLNCGQIFRNPSSGCNNYLDGRLSLYFGFLTRPIPTLTIATYLTFPEIVGAGLQFTEVRLVTHLPGHLQRS